MSYKITYKGLDDAFAYKYTHENMPPHIEVKARKVYDFYQGRYNLNIDFSNDPDIDWWGMAAQWENDKGDFEEAAFEFEPDATASKVLRSNAQRNRDENIPFTTEELKLIDRLGLKIIDEIGRPTDQKPTDWWNM